MQLTRQDNSRLALRCVLVLLSVCVFLQVRPRLGWTVHLDETWVLESFAAGRRNIIPPLHFRLMHLASYLPLPLETALRLPSLAMAVLAMAVVYSASRFSAVRSGFLAPALMMGFLAFCSPLVFYASICKSYSAEVCLATLHVLLLGGVLRRPGDWRIWCAYGLAAGAFCLTLYPGIFLLPTFVVAVLACRLLRLRQSGVRGLSCTLRTALRDPGIRYGILVHGAVALAFSFAYCAYLNPRGIGPAEANYRPGLVDYWGFAFWDGSLSFMLSRTLLAVGHILNVTWMGVYILVLVCALGAWLALRDEQIEEAIHVVLPGAVLATLLVASLLRLYPYGEPRLTLFVAPLVLWPFCLFAARLARLPGMAGMACAGALGLFVLLYVWNGVIRDPYGVGYMGAADLTPAIRILENSPATGAIVAGDATYAALRWHLPSRRSAIVRVASVAQLPSGSLWALLSTSDKAELQAWKALCQSAGAQTVVEWTTHGAVLALVDVTGSSAAPGAASP